MKIAVLFPGQGSQYVGMGKEFVETNSRCADIMERAESVCDFPIRSLSFNGPIEQLTRASVVQPALTLTNLICFQALKDRLPDDIQIDGFAGHSAGEYSALCAAGVISIQDAVRLVERRGFFMEREGDKNPGGMRAILGLSIDEVESLINNHEGQGIVTIANYNTAQQIVISGNQEGLDAISAAAEQSEAKVVPLKVSVANHSPLVVEAVPDFFAFMSSIKFNKPKSTVYFNVTAEPEQLTYEIKQIMARQIASRVRWYEIISRMIGDGFDTFIEAGPNKVLKGMMRRIVPKGSNVISLQFDTPESLDKCFEKLGLN
jgi:[acyl-carrier-protein] S-malonyltransferase